MSWAQRLFAPQEQPQAQAAPKKSYSEQMFAPPEPLDSVRNRPMPDFINLDPAGDAAVALGEPPKPPLMDRISNFFTGDDRKTPETAALPEIGKMKGGPGTNLRMGLGLMTSTTDAQMADVIKSNYPDAVFSQDDKGNIFVEAGGQKYQFDKPGPTDQDVLRVGADIASYMPSAKGASMLKRPLAKITGAMVGAATTSAARDALSAVAGSEQGISPERAMMAAGGEAVIPLGGAAIKKVLGRGTPLEAGNLAPEMFEGTMDAGKATGVDLFPAQRTGLMSQLEKQRFVAELPGGSQIAANALLKQNKQAYDATISYLDSIAPPSSVITGPGRFRTAAQKLNDNIKQARAEKASPLYNEAFDTAATTGLKIDVTPAVTLGRTIVEEYPAGGKIAAPVSRAVKMIEAAKGDLKKLHNVKTEIDQMIQTGIGASGSPLRGTAKRELVRVQETLLAQLDAASPTYAKARQTFRDNSGIIDEVGQSVVGGAASVKDTQLKKLSKTVFDAEETNPEVIARTRELIDSVDPGAYDELLRVELERRIGKAAVTQEGIQNTPGQIGRAIFGNDKQRKALYTALRPEQRKVAAQLELALQAASRGRPGGSQTASRQELREEIRGGVARELYNFISSPVKALNEVGQRAMIERRANAIAKIMYDPSYTKDVDAVVRMMSYDPDSAGQHFARMLQSAMGAGGAELAD